MPNPPPQPMPQIPGRGVKAETHSRQVSFGLKVTRCGCGHPEQHNGSPQCQCSRADGLTWHSADGEEHICPSPKRVDALGTVDRWDASLIGKFLWILQRPLVYCRIKIANLRTGSWS